MVPSVKLDTSMHSGTGGMGKMSRFRLVSLRSSSTPLSGSAKLRNLVINAVMAVINPAPKIGSPTSPGGSKCSSATSTPARVLRGRSTHAFLPGDVDCVRTFRPMALSVASASACVWRSVVTIFAWSRGRSRSEVSCAVLLSTTLPFAMLVMAGGTEPTEGTR